MTHISDPLLLFKINPNPGVLLELSENEPIIAAVNAAFESVFGVKESDLPGTKLLKLPFLNSDYVAALRSSIERVRLTGSAENIEIAHLTDAPSKEIYVSTAICPVLDKGKLTHILLTLTDCSEYQLLLEHTEEAFIVVDRKLKVTSFNAKFAAQYKRLLGKTVKKGDLIIEYVLPERREMLSHVYERVFQGEAIKTEIELFSEEGEPIIISNSFTPIIKGSVVEGVIVNSTDVSQVRIAEKNLRESENRYRTLIEKGSDALVIVTADFQPVYISPSVEGVLGYTEEEMTKLEVLSLFHSEDVEPASLKLAEALQKPGIPIEGHTSRMKHKDGSRHWIEANITNMLHQPAIGGLVIAFRDVTKRVIAEISKSETLKELEERLKELNCLYKISKLDEKELGLDKLLYSAAELLPSGWQFPEIAVAAISFQGKQYTTKGFKETAWSLYRENRRIAHSPLTIQVNYLKDTGEEEPFLKEEYELTEAVLEILSLKIEQGQTELKLRNSRDRLQSLLHSIDGIVWESNADTLEFTYVSPRVQSILGYSPEECLSDPEFRIKHIHEENKNEVVGLYLEHPVGDSCFEYRMRTRDSGVVWVRDTVSLVQEKGKPRLLRGIMTDITETKIAQREREFERKNKEALINTTTDVIWSVNPEKRLIAANNAFLDSLKVMTGRIFQPGDKVLEAFSEDLQLQWNTLYDRALSGESFSYELNMPDLVPGIDYWYEARLDPIFENDNIIGIACRSRDITETKRFQKNLLDINKKLETAQRIGKFGYIELNLKTQEFYWSEQVYEIWGVSPETYEITVENFLSTIHPEDLPALLKEMEAAEKGLQEYDFEYRIILPSGEVKWIHELGKLKQGLIKNEPIFEGTVQDITADTASVEALKKQKEFIETSFDNLPVGIVVNKADTGEAILMNKKFSEIYGWPEEEIRTAEMFFERIWPDEVFRKNMVEQIKTDVMSGDINRMNWNAIPIYTKTGEEKIINSNNIPLFDQNMIISSVVDVTEEVKAKKEKEQILESISDAFCALDENWNYTYANHEVERILNVKAEALTGKSIWDLFPDIVDTALYRNFVKTESEKISTTFEFYYPPLNTWFEISVYPAQKGITAYFKDITEKRNYILKLEDFNARLRKIAWMQSHVVRAPVARIMGLVNLIQSSGYHEEPLKEMLDHIHVSAKELDGIIQEIVKNTGKLDME